MVENDVEDVSGYGMPLTESGVKEAEDELAPVVFKCPIDHSGGTAYLKGWLTENSPFPPVVMVHDLGEGVKLYRGLAQSLKSLGFSVYCFDLRGHGRSGHILGHSPSFDCLVKDLLQIVSWVRFKSDRKVPIVLSQGVGSMITTYFLEVYPDYAKYSISIAPVFKLGPAISLPIKVAIRIVAEMLPRLKLPRSLSQRMLTFGWLSSSKAQQKFQHLSFGLARELMNASEDLPSQFIRVTHEALIIIPQQVPHYDAITLKNLVAQHPLKDRLTLIEVGNIGAHPLTEPKERQVVLDSIIPWLEEKLSCQLKTKVP
ncbi:MAG: alpha/beta fold hydrolase [Pseudobacteriovorax sp.]|nr:alpha/beta fold hydrolase [Pseudobacteriovorax sp.]